MIKHFYLKNIYNQIATLLLFVFITGCGNDDASNDPIGSDEPIEIDNQEDSLGNLIIVNQLSDQLYLYHDNNILLKKISAVDRFRVYVPVNENEIKQLKIWKKSNVNDPLLPDSSKVYRSWNVELKNSGLDQDIVSWIINDSESDNDVGELILNYPSLDATGSNVIYHVDLFLNDTNSLLATSLSPGLQGRKIGLDYGYYNLRYLFWFQSDNRINISWNDTSVIDDQNSVIINSNNPSRTIEVEPYFGNSIGRKGKIKVVNHTSDYLRIVFNDSTLIEYIEMESLPATGLSLLYPDGGNFTFTIPEDYYSFSAKNIDTDLSQDTRNNIYVMELHQYTWDIYENNIYSDISITNNTGQDLTLHDGETGNYLGIYLPGGSTTLNSIPDSLNKLIAKNLTQSEDAKLENITSIWRIDEVSPAFHISLDPNSIQNGDIVSENTVEFSWEIGTENQSVSVQLLNSSFEPYSEIVNIDSPITSFTYQYLDESEENEFYTFRLNSFSMDGEEFGWQEVTFEVDAIQSNGLSIFPLQKQLSGDSLNEVYPNHSFDVFLENVDSLASFYIECEFDPEVFDFNRDLISLGQLFDGCPEPIILFSENINTTGVIGINVSLIGNECQFVAGSGILFNISLIPDEGILVEDSHIFINSNSSLRNKNNSEVPISNIFLNYPLKSRVVFN
ncbi:MAG: hypothetical protein ACJZ1Q_00660 [Candidatus Neomarinimicrobiota bacterium]